MAKGINRRTVLQAAPALAIAPAAALASETDETFALIAAHREAEAAFNRACEATDSVLTGRPGTSKEWGEASASSDALVAAALALCAYAPTTTAGSRAKVEAILTGYIAEASEFDIMARALVRSMAQMVRA